MQVANICPGRCAAGSRKFLYPLTEWAFIKVLLVAEDSCDSAGVSNAAFNQARYIYNTGGIVSR
jgi:hypothetical protein